MAFVIHPQLRVPIIHAAKGFTRKETEAGQLSVNWWWWQYTALCNFIQESYVRGCAVTRLQKKCTKNSRFWLWGTGVQNGTFSWVHVTTKVHFHSLEEQLPQNISSSNKICLFISSICPGVPYCLRWFPCHWGLFLLSLFTEKIFPITSSISDRPLVSLVLPLVFQPWETISYLEVCGTWEVHWILSLLDSQNIVF